jgi:hypothetical protein
MRVESRHYSFDVEKNPDETHEQHRARAFSIAALLDENPEYFNRLSEVIRESQSFVPLVEAGCNPPANQFKFFKPREMIVEKPVADSRILPKSQEKHTAASNMVMSAKLEQRQ